MATKSRKDSAGIGGITVFRRKPRYVHSEAVVNGGRTRDADRGISGEADTGTGPQVTVLLLLSPLGGDAQAQRVQLDEVFRVRIGCRRLCW